MDMAGRYSARAERIQIISVDTVPASKVRRESTRQFHVQLNFKNIQIKSLLFIFLFTLELQNQISFTSSYSSSFY